MQWLPDDPLLALVFQTGLAVIGCSILMLIAVFLLRARLVIRQRRERRFNLLWQPVLAQCVHGVPENLPGVPRNMLYHFLKLWIYHHESLAGSAPTNLEAMALAMQLDKPVRELIGSDDLRLRLIALVTLGKLGDRTRLSELRELVADPSPVLSLVAARALLQIDPAAELPFLIAVMARREDWPLARLVTMLREAGSDSVTQPLVTALEAAIQSGEEGNQIVRLLNLMEVAHTGQVAPVASRIIRHGTVPDQIAAALRVVQDPRDREVVRALTRHEKWFVRARAARVIGRIGDDSDRKLLVRMLGDAHWWVRYHAARALLALPGARIEDIEKVQATLGDRYAADMLGQAIAEARAK